MSQKYTILRDPIPLEEEALLVNETLFHNANGYLGVRAGFEEGYPEGTATIRGQYINGFYDIAEMKQAEKLYGMPEQKQTMVNVADTQGIVLFVEGERFDLFSGTVIESSRMLDMEKGVTVRRVRWCSPKGREVLVEITRMASFRFLPLFLIDYHVTPLNFSGEIRIESSHLGKVQNYVNAADPRVAGEQFQHILPEDAAYPEDGISVIPCSTASSGLTAATAVCHKLDVPHRAEYGTTGPSASAEFYVAAKEGEPVRLLKYTIMCDSRRYGDCASDALRILHECMALPPEMLYGYQEEYLRDFWSRSAVDVEGDEELNEAVCYNLYQLLQSAGKDSSSNIAAKGLSGEGYEGHYFWDTEMYMLPFFILTQPELAASLIRNRYSMLSGAREQARILGHTRGAAYPWRTITGPECSGFYPSGSAQYHISGDIIYTVAAYYLATGDYTLVRDCGAEMAFEVSRMFLDLGNYNGDRFEIHTVTGPDEYTCMVSNNYYTNALVQYVLRWSVKFYELLKEHGDLPVLEQQIGITPEEIADFKKAADAMYLPYDKTLGINPQDDSFLRKPVWDLAATPEEKHPLLLHYHPMYLHRFQVCKQADTVLAHFILEDAQDLETIRRSFLYYETVTTHDSSLSTCIFSIVASKLGMQDKAMEYFGDSAKLDLFNTHKNTKDGIHTANMGGNYMAIVYGFAGLRLKEDGLHFSPALPKQWQSYRFCICYRGSAVEVFVCRDAMTLTLLDGDAVPVIVEGRQIILHDTCKTGIKS